ncbi:MAG: tRNA threonylcarbamoyladenosine dehydratase [Clostridiales bacterium]|nr:tRNA threonylcarbamoyladenosine dehydratase [Clostridiales bacterium]
MLNEFSRTELILGKDGLNKLALSRVAVFGIGGVGGYAVEALIRSGVGAVDLIDDDKVCLTNINRQIYATQKTVGRYKVDVAAERIAEINPNAQVRTYKTFFTPQTAGEFNFSDYDYIIDAIDTVTGKIELVMQAEKAGVPIISAMGAGNKLDPTAFEVADIYKTSVCPLARVMRRELAKRGVKKLKVVYSKEQPITPDGNLEQDCKEEGRGTQKREIPGSTAFVPPVVGLIIASEVVKEIINK